MAKWTKTTESLPGDDLPLCAGDRVIGIARWREWSAGPMQPHIVILEATEDGWKDMEGNGNSIHDCELWTLEKDLVQIADVIS